MLVDAADYFRRLGKVLEAAQHSILIVGWDFDHRIRLEPDSGPRLGDLLRSLVDARPDLRVRVLIWSFALLHGPGSATALLFGARWHDHPRIEVKLDRTHAFYACHHQKIVCIDDVVAFAGGVDLTVGRWDNRLHAISSRRRVRPEGTRYAPVHDVQMMLVGDAARDVAGVARERWLEATGESIPPMPAAAAPSVSAPSDFAGIPVAIARSASAATGPAALQEVAALTIDCIVAARRWLYIETQYLTSRLVGEALAHSLSAPTGPEIVIVLTRRSSGFVEHLVMGKNRDRLRRRLRHADPHHRLRCYYPVAAGRQKSRPIQVHSKVMIVDDRLLRVGSANLNNRSMHLDSECDLAIESGNPIDQRRIAGIRNRLLAEHLGAAPERVEAIMAETGSMFVAIDRLNNGPRGLHPFSPVPVDGPIRPIPLTWLLDPPRPLGRSRGADG